MNKINEYYHKEAGVVINELSSSFQGLSSVEAKKRLLENGHNELPDAKRESYVSIFFHQFKSPLIYILLTSGAIIFLMKEFTDALVIFFVLFFNAIIGTVQEGKAQNTFLALKKFIKGRAMVMRDGNEIMVSDREIVVGEIIILREGEKVPADARIIESNALKINESALTGESIPKLKVAEIIEKKNVSVMNQDNMVFNGTVIVSGIGKAIVTATGLDTFLGEIAKETLSIDSEFPLKNDIKKLSRLVILFVLIVSLILLFYGLINNHPVKDVIKTIIAIAVSVIPEGLPIVMTLVLAGGVWRMGRKNVLVKKLQAVEVLGEVKILAVDKTGTVTKNELLIEEVYSGAKTFAITGSGYEPYGEAIFDGKVIDPLNHEELLISAKIAALSGNAGLIFNKKKNQWKVTGDPTEGAMAVFSQKIGFHRDELLSEMVLVDEIPFDYELKLHASLHSSEKGNFLAVTSSPEIILKMSESEWASTGAKEISEQRKKEIRATLLKMSKKGLRVIGFAFCYTNENKIDRKAIPKLIFGGFFGIKDALRKEVRNAVMQVEASGIKVVMITGDHEITAKAIAQDAGIYKSGDGILSGEEIDVYDEQELAKVIKMVSVFVRVTPSHKLKIIKAYQSNGIMIAMTGDGVNDALSLSAADIGIGMGKAGTEVAKEAADIILLDDNFGSISHGVEEGRDIFIKIKKVILYLFSTSLGEVFVLLGALVVGFPLPILAAQILWLNLVTDGFLDMALAMEVKDDGVNGVYKKNFIVDKTMIQRMFFMAIPMAIGTLFLFGQIYELDAAKASTISLTTLAVFQWFNAWNCRHESKSIFQLNPFSNRFLVAATAIVISLQILAVYNPIMQRILKTVPLTIGEWLIIISVAFSIVLVEEARKFVYYQAKRVK